MNITFFTKIPKQFQAFLDTDRLKLTYHPPLGSSSDALSSYFRTLDALFLSFFGWEGVMQHCLLLIPSQQSAQVDVMHEWPISAQ